MNGPEAKRIAISGATLIDGSGNQPLPEALVLVKGDRIEKVDTGVMVDIQAGTEVIDARGKFLVPGLVDAHTHLFHEGFVPLPPKGSLLAYASVVTANNLRTALQAGITTLRAISDGYHADLAMRSAVRDHILFGPRIYAAGNGICMTGGHGSGLAGVVEVDGPLAVRKAIREEVKAGVDFIKLLTSHRTDTPEFSLEEIKAGVDEAHRLGKRVAIHAGNYVGTRMAAEAGVDTIEHCNFFDDETAEMMAEKGIIVVPTVWVYHSIQEKIQGLAGDVMDKLGAELKLDMDELQATRIWADRVVERYPRTIEMLRSHGVRIAAGTDNVIADEPFAMLHKEMEYMTRMGMSNMEAIVAASGTSAEATGHGDEFGIVEAGKYADLIMVDRDPLKDISVMAEVNWVMKEGHVIPLYPEWTRKPINAPLW
jgi:imidazolonepropionase-like amidohydrolase